MAYELNYKEPIDRLDYFRTISDCLDGFGIPRQTFNSILTMKYLSNSKL